MAGPVRELLIDQAACDTARAWTTAFRVELAREERRVEGGWPGTLPEARMRASTHVGSLLAKRSMPALTHAELGRVARITYDEARRSWRSLCERP
jgi:hypothetical protein